MPLRVVAQLRHSYGSCSIIICISMGSCSMAREVVTRRTVLHHYCSTKIRFEPPTQSVTYLLVAYVIYFKCCCIIWIIMETSFHVPSLPMAAHKRLLLHMCSVVMVLFILVPHDTITSKSNNSIVTNTIHGF